MDKNDIHADGSPMNTADEGAEPSSRFESYSSYTAKYEAAGNEEVKEPEPKFNEERKGYDAEVEAIRLSLEKKFNEERKGYEAEVEAKRLSLEKKIEDLQCEVKLQERAKEEQKIHLERELEAQKSSFETQLQQLQSEIKDHEASKVHMVKAIEAAKEEREIQHKEETERFNEERKRYEVELEAKRLSLEKMQQLQSEIKDHEASKVHMIKAIEAAKEEREIQHKEETERNKKKIRDLAYSLEQKSVSYKQKLEECKRQHRECKQNLEKSESKVKVHQERIDELEGQLVRAQEEKDLLEKDLQIESERVLSMAAQNNRRSKESVNLNDFIRPDTVTDEYSSIESGSRMDLLETLENTSENLKMCSDVFMYIFSETKKFVDEMLSLKSDNEVADIKRTFRGLDPESCVMKGFVQVLAGDAPERFPRISKLPEFKAYVMESAFVCWAMLMLAKPLLPIMESGEFDKKRAVIFAECKRSPHSTIDFSVWPTLVFQEDPKKVVSKGVVYISDPKEYPATSSLAGSGSLSDVSLEGEARAHRDFKERRDLSCPGGDRETLPLECLPNECPIEQSNKNSNLPERSDDCEMRDFSYLDAHGQDTTQTSTRHSRGLYPLSGGIQGESHSSLATGSLATGSLATNSPTTSSHSHSLPPDLERNLDLYPEKDYYHRLYPSQHK